MEAASGTTITNAIYINNTGTVTNLLKFSTVGGCLSTSATALNGVTTSHKIKVNIPVIGTVYIPVVTTGMA